MNGYTKWVEHDDMTVNAEQNDESIKSKIIFCLGGKAAEAVTNGYGKDYIFKLLKRQQFSSDLKNAIYFAKQIDADHIEDLIGSVWCICSICYAASGYNRLLMCFKIICLVHCSSQCMIVKL